MFRRLPDNGPGRPEVIIRFEGKLLTAREGDTVAAAILTTASAICRNTPVTGAERTPYCMMGICHDCLVEIDGNANQQSCQILVHPGMDIQRQSGLRDAENVAKVVR